MGGVKIHVSQNLFLFRRPRAPSSSVLAPLPGSGRARQEPMASSGRLSTSTSPGRRAGPQLGEARVTQRPAHSPSRWPDVPGVLRVRARLGLGTDK